MAKRLRIYLIVAFAICLMATILLFSACANDGHIHSYGEWEETAPSCEADGQRVRKCSECGYEQTETIEMLGHDWQAVETTVYPTCEQEGLRSAVCSRCDAKVDEQVIPALNHDWNVQTVKTETCQHGGEYLYTCKRANCSAIKTVTTDSVDHKWSVVNRVEATCENNGYVTYKCEFDCDTPRVDTLKAIGHSFSNFYTVDEEPTYETEGTQSKHCTNIGCSVTSDTQSIPRLQVTYTVSIKDSCGSYYYGNATLEFYVNGQLEETVAMADSRVNTISLHSPSCNVKITGLNNGYSANADGYDLSAEQPSVTVCLSASVMDAPKITLPFYKTGSILYDQEYTYYGPDDELITTTLKDILATKKGILMNFYYDGCPPCNSEMPALIEASKENAADIFVLMINVNYESDTKILSFRSRNSAQDTPLCFLTDASNRNTYKDFASVVKYAPTTAYIDCNGQVVDMHVGALTKSAFNSSINNYILKRYETLHPTETTTNYTEATTNTAVAILPSKKFDF